MSKNVKKRNEIDSKFKWNLEAMYENDDLWENAIADSLKKAQDFTAFKGHIADDADTLLDALEQRNDIWQTIERAYVYARMRRDEDNTVEKYQSMCDKAETAISNISALMSFFTPELMEKDSDALLAMLNQKEELKIYDFMFKDMLREKEHILSQTEETLLAQISQITPATNNIFTMLNNADLKFGQVTDDKGNKITLTHGNYISLMESHDRAVREEAYEHMYQAYKDMINTIATTYNFNTKTDVTVANIRKYPSARAAALASDNINEEVYDNLVSVIHKYLPVLHRYIALRKQLLGVDELKMSDVYVPLVQLPERKIDFAEGKEMMLEAVAPLGDDYIKHVKEGFNSGWIDVYENVGKTSGAYSFGSYDSMPYVMMNYADSLKDVFTLVHEMGHSMHSYYTRTNQPFIYGDYSIFCAEVASTVNENLLMKHLIAKETDDEMKKYLINYHIEEFRTTVFRQTMFAEFEDWTHKTIEAGGTLTADSMCNYYNELNKKYFGDALADDPWIKYEWARIPHFYNSFYVYQYATGYSAAAAISDIILEKGPDDYLKFLKTGSSDYPVELLKIAGVDMSKPEPIERAMKVFESLVDEFEKLTTK